jgi:hypothetical protein
VATSHYCPENPEGEKWEDGPVNGCPHHRKNRNAQSIKWGRKARRNADREAGVVGIDRGDYIHG